MNASEDKSAKADNSAVQRKRLSDQIGWRGLAGTILIVVVLILLTTAYFRYFGDHNHIKFVFVVAIGGLLGLTEILGRYTDSPTAALKSPGAVIYVLVNAIASGVALYLLTELAPAAVSNPISQVLLAGLGAMAFLRSSVFKAKVGNEEVPIGPAIILDTLLKFADAQVDRGRAEDRAERIGEVVQSLPLGQVGVDLPRLCFALMQNLSVDIQQKLLNDITLIVTDTKRSESMKVLEVGLVLWSRVGIGTLVGAVTLLKNPQMAAAIAPGVTSGSASNIVPPTPQGSPHDLLPDIRRQLAQEQHAATAGS